ncbi:hypothetical protein CBL_02523 [Carabus blaptoides fortunei]
MLPAPLPAVTKINCADERRTTAPSADEPLESCEEKLHGMMIVLLDCTLVQTVPDLLNWSQRREHNERYDLCAVSCTAYEKFGTAYVYGQAHILIESSSLSLWLTRVDGAGVQHHKLVNHCEIHVRSGGPVLHVGSTAGGQSTRVDIGWGIVHATTAGQRTIASPDAYSIAVEREARTSQHISLERLIVSPPDAQQPTYLNLPLTCFNLYNQQNQHVLGADMADGLPIERSLPRIYDSQERLIKRFPDKASTKRLPNYIIFAPVRDLFLSLSRCLYGSISSYYSVWEHPPIRPAARLCVRPTLDDNTRMRALTVTLAVILEWLLKQTAR